MAQEDEKALGRRELKKRETRQTIRDVALDLALANGVENLTVEVIARAAGVSPRTFFNYFASKEDALVTQAAEGASLLSAFLLERPAEEPPLQALHNAITASGYFDSGPIDRDRVVARHRLTHDHPALLAHHLGKIALLERAFAKALAQRLAVDPDEDIYPEVLAAVAMSMIRVAMRRWVVKGDRPLDELLDAAFQRLEQLDVAAEFESSAG